MHQAKPSRASFTAVLTDSRAGRETVARDVDGFRDALGKPVDAGIKSIVVALNALGFPTTASCEGHLHWGIAAPWVDIQPKATPALATLKSERHAIASKIETLERHNSHAACLDELYQKQHRLTRELEHPTQLLARDLLSLLAMFYRHRDVPYDQMIAIDMRSVALRMQCHGTEVQVLATTLEKDANLKRYQAEMVAFAAFLTAYDGAQRET